MSETGFPPVSVVATVKNEEDNIALLLDSLCKLDYAGNLEIVVVDGGSSDRTTQIISKYSNLKLITANCSIGEGRNIGIRNSTGEIVAFIDGDCVAAADWIRNIVRYFLEDKDIAVVGGPYVPLGRGGLVQSYLALYQGSYFPKTSGFTTYSHIASGNAAIRREVIGKIGGFDPEADQFEDEDIHYRISKLGLKLFFADDARVFHKYRVSFRDVSEVTIRRSKANFEFNKKHRRYRQLLFPYTRTLLLACLAIFAITLATGSVVLFAVELGVLFLVFYSYSLGHLSKVARSPEVSLKTKLVLPLIDLHVRLLESFGFIFFGLLQLGNGRNISNLTH
jgi:GT2 family glycosyltransferase